MVLTISSEAEFEKILKESAKNWKLLIVDFFTTWCAPCVQFSPEFDRIANEFQNDAIFVKVDCEKLQNLAVSNKIKIIPTIKGYFNMQEAFSLSGSVGFINLIISYLLILSISAYFDLFKIINVRNFNILIDDF